jgi:hypothetical protein
VLGIDVNALRDELLALAEPGSPELTKIVVENGTIVTVLGDEMRVWKNKRSATTRAIAAKKDKAA